MALIRIEGDNAVLKVIGQSRSILEVQGKIAKVASGATPVLLVGENGTGKEFFARMLHDLSPRKNGPFVVVNFTAIPKDLQESELFGYKLVVSAGRITRKIGKLGIADRGTVFLDKVAHMELVLQAKLLQMIEGRGFRRIGERIPILANIRFVAATNSDLKEAVAQQTFLEGLYYRLNTFPIVLPPLRDRREDIVLLVEHFLTMYSRGLNKEGLKVSPEAFEVMMKYPWPGNIDELQSCIERAVLLCNGQTIMSQNLDLHFPKTKPAASAEGISLQTRSLQEATQAAVRAVESQMIERALRQTGWNKSKAAEKLQVSYKTLLTKIKEYGLEKQTGIS